MDIGFTLVAQALAFAGLIWIIATKIWPPLMNAIEERQQKIAEGLAAADRSQKDLAQAQEKVNEALKDARGKANEIIDQAHARANQIVEAAKNEAIAEANRLPYGLAAYAWTTDGKRQQGGSGIHGGFCGEETGSCVACALCRRSRASSIPAWSRLPRLLLPACGRRGTRWCHRAANRG